MVVAKIGGFMKKVTVFLFFLLPFISFADNDVDGYKRVLKDNEWGYSQGIDVEKILSSKQSIFKRRDFVNNGFTLGVTSVDIPFYSYPKDENLIDNVYKILSLTGVDSVKSSAADWSRISNYKKSGFDISNLKFQLEEAKKYKLKSSFIIGYPPIGYGNYGRSIRTAVSSKYIPNFINYLNFITKYLNSYDVSYVELGNEVDASSHWWLKSTPTQYVNEAKLLKDAIKRNSPNIKLGVFSATYSRHLSDEVPHQGRNFIQECSSLGINSYADFYSLHHVSYPNDDGLVSFLTSFNIDHKFNKKIYDTEQMDISDQRNFTSQPFNIIKIGAVVFGKYKLSHLDYFMAKDGFIEPKVYPNGFTQGLFDINWNPKPRLLAFTMLIDAVKGRYNLKSVERNNGQISYIFQDKDSISKYKYSLITWNDKETTSKTLHKNDFAENWKLNQFGYNDKVTINGQPTVFFSNSLDSLMIYTR